MRISDWSSDVCSSDLGGFEGCRQMADGEHLPEVRLRIGQLLRDRRPGRVSRADPRVVPGLRSASENLVHQSAQFAKMGERNSQIGRASCRERVCHYVSISVVAEY